jgi:hypothetical protein
MFPSPPMKVLTEYLTFFATAHERMRGKALAHARFAWPSAAYVKRNSAEIRNGVFEMRFPHAVQ